MPCARKQLFLHQSQNMALLQLEKESASSLCFTICFRTVHEKATPSVSALSASVADALRRVPKIALVIPAMNLFCSQSTAGLLPCLKCWYPFLSWSSVQASVISSSLGLPLFFGLCLMGAALSVVKHQCWPDRSQTRNRNCCSVGMVSLSLPLLLFLSTSSVPLLFPQEVGPMFASEHLLATVDGQICNHSSSSCPGSQTQATTPGLWYRSRCSCCGYRGEPPSIENCVPAGKSSRAHSSRAVRPPQTPLEKRHSKLLSCQKRSPLTCELCSSHHLSPRTKRI